MAAIFDWIGRGRAALIGLGFLQAVR